MSVKMSVKDVENYSPRRTFDLRGQLWLDVELAGHSFASESATQPVETLWATPISWWITKEFVAKNGGKLCVLTRMKVMKRARKVEARTLVFQGMQGNSATARVASNTPARLWITSKRRVAGSYRICPRPVSPSSVEVFRRLRRDVMTVTALLRIRDVEARLAVPRSTVYNLIKSGVLERVYIASSPRIVDESVDAYIDSLRRPVLPTSFEGSN